MIGIVVAVTVLTNDFILRDFVASMERPNGKIQYSTFLDRGEGLYS